MINYSPVKIKTAAAIAIAAMIWLAASVIIGGCGKKGPPKPPSGNKPPPVMNLAYSVTGNTIKLSWTVPQTTEKAKSPVAGFLIYQFQQSAHEKECPNCPVIFKQVGDVPGRSGSAALVFTQTIKPGYRYIYKVKAYDNGGTASSDSNFVEFLF